MTTYTEHPLTAHGEACHQCRTLLTEARILYTLTHRLVRTGDHPDDPGHRGGCWAEYQTRTEVAR